MVSSEASPFRNWKPGQWDREKRESWDYKMKEWGLIPLIDSPLDCTLEEMRRAVEKYHPVAVVPSFEEDRYIVYVRRR